MTYKSLNVTSMEANVGGGTPTHGGKILLFNSIHLHYKHSMTLLRKSIYYVMIVLACHINLLSRLPMAVPFL